MKSKRILLLKTLLKSTSGLNVLKYSKDKKRRGQIIGGYVGMAILYVLLIGIVILIAYGLGKFGLSKALPGIDASIVILISFFFTLLKSSGYLFGFKEYDMLMSMPFPVKTIIADKFLYMYVNSLPWTMSLSAATLISYCLIEGASFPVIIVWVIEALFLPIIPMVIASALGALFVRIGSGFKHKKLIQTILTFAFIFICFCSRFIIEALIRNSGVENILHSISDISNSVGNYFLPIKWFSDSITELSISSILLFIGVSIVLFEVFFSLVSIGYKKINSNLSTGTSHKKYSMKSQKKKGMVKSIAYKEFKRMIGSTPYVTNVAFGEILVVIAGVLSLFIGGDKIVSLFINNENATAEMMAPALPVFVYLFSGMMASTCCSPSLEGKNYWIIKTMPIDPMDDCKGKMLFNMYLEGLFALIGTICLCISFKVPLIDAILANICVLVMSAFSTTFGMACGLRHRKLDWENEIEVVKQGSAISRYMIPNIIITIVLLIICMIFGRIIGAKIIFGVLIVAYGLFALINYNKVKKLARKM